MPPRFDVTPDDIDRVVAVFYAAVRKDDVLGPVFAAKVTDWPPHEAKIAAFWRNAILLERSYSETRCKRIWRQATCTKAISRSGWTCLTRF